ncbi:pilus assembly protein PilP [Desulfurivibrio sp. D14AmB]|uniref:pilus assembly protein PilP n=1 Tax=Desulfurivibrio sp. D14AmB TaxID=3374370 RepID=UPI00376ED8EE
MALNRERSGGITALIVALLLLWPGAGLTQSLEAAPGEEPSRHPPLSLLEELQLGPDPFFYRQTGRPDPFMPFVTIRPPASPAPGDPDKPEAEVLTGLRRFEPEQLTLTAIVMSDKAPLAMVEDSTGYGHIIRRGSAIGRSGRVERIAADRVIIRQELVTLTGEQEYRTIELVLTREGEDK